MKKLFSSLKLWLGFSRTEENNPTAVDIMVDTLAETEELMTPGGMSSVASAGGSTSEKPNFFNDETVSMQEISDSPLLFKACGHYGAQRFAFAIWGNKQTLELKDELITQENGTATAKGECPKCFFENAKQFSIRCCLCGYAILPGDGVALYYKSSKGINRETATFINDNAVGCLLWDCCPSGGFFAGHWTFGGFQSAFDGKTAAEKVFSDSEPIVYHHE